MPANTGAFKASHRCIKDRFLLLCKPSPVYRLSRTESYIIFIQPRHMTCVVKQTQVLSMQACKAERYVLQSHSVRANQKEQIRVFYGKSSSSTVGVFSGRPMTPANSRCAVSGALSSWSCQLAGELRAHAGTALQATTVKSDNLF